MSEQELADAAQLASLADETPEGRSIVVLAKEKYGIRGRDIHELGAKFIPFTAQSRMSGVEINGSWVRKGAVDAVLDYLKASATGRCRRAGAKPGVSAELTREVNAHRRDDRQIGRHAARRRQGRHGCSASFTSRISSRAAFASASPSFAAWASAPS